MGRPDRQAYKRAIETGHRTGGKNASTISQDQRELPGQFPSVLDTVIVPKARISGDNQEKEKKTGNASTISTRSVPVTAQNIMASSSESSGTNKSEATNAHQATAAPVTSAAANWAAKKKTAALPMALQWQGQSAPTAAPAPTDFGELSTAAATSSTAPGTKANAEAPTVKKAKNVTEESEKSSSTIPKDAISNSTIIPTVASAPVVELKMDLPAPIRSGTMTILKPSGRGPGEINPPGPATALHASNSLYQVPTSSIVEQEQFTSLLRAVSQRCPDAWNLLLGLYLQESGRDPFQLGCSGLSNLWQRDCLRADKLAKDPNQDLGQWAAPVGEPLLGEIVQLVDNGGQKVFEDFVRSWAPTADQRLVTSIVEKAGWRSGLDRDMDPEAWRAVDEILKMDPGEAKEQMVAQAKAEAPRFFQACEDDYLFCGVQVSKKRHISSEDDDSDYEYESEYTVRALRVKGCDHRVESPRSPPKKRKLNLRMATGPGQPTQFHGVPLEERAIDSKGNRLPWALEYHEDHPSARGQKRHPEEKGPFGKSMRRKGSSRIRTATPAKKENPTLDGFAQALKYEAKKAAEAKHAADTSKDDTNVASRNAPSYTKEPTQIMIYGYPSSRQYAAIDLYEKCSGGMICEDYDREPPAELHKYPNTFSATSAVHPRPLTKQEKALAFKYDGGNHWIKLTCDSAEGAARAVELSPVQVYGHWVYAELYNGKAPASDRPIPITEEDRRQGPFNSPRPPRKSSHTLGAAFSQQASTHLRATSTLPRSFNPDATAQANTQPTPEPTSLSSSTASSGTATGLDHPTLRNRHPSQTEQDPRSPTNTNEIAPGIPRYMLRPASEAFLPQPTWFERQVQSLRAQGLIPTDFIGDGLPLLDNGDFDWAKASWYWRICFWCDSHLGTDICGLKEN